VTPLPRDLVPIGTFTRIHGLRGEIVLRADPSMIGDLRAGMTLVVTPAPASSKAQSATPSTASDHKLLKIRAHKNGAVVALGQVQGANQAELLIGSLVAAERSDLPELEDGQYYDTDLIGCEVVDAEGKPLGRLSAVLATGANDIYSIDGTDGEILAPAITGVLLKIDLAERRVHVNGEGLVWPEPATKPATKPAVRKESSK
jgi:16S rRNA processing protein RimM